MNHPSYQLSEYKSNGNPCVYFHIEDIQHATPFKSDIIHSHGYYIIYLFESGKSKHIVELETYECADNSVSVLFPHQYHQLLLDKKAKGSVILFNEELFCSEALRKELRAYSINLRAKLNSMQLSKQQFFEIQQLFDIANNLTDDLNIIKKEQIRHLIKLIILKLMDFSKKGELNQKEISESNLFIEFNTLIDDNFKEIRMVSEYAERLGITQKKLNQLSRQYGKQTALQLIHSRIFLEAKRLLAFSEMSHKEIAYELKFDSPSAFNKFIMNKAQRSPSELQKQLANIYTKAD